MLQTLGHIQTSVKSRICGVISSLSLDASPLTLVNYLSSVDGYLLTALSQKLKDRGKVS